MIVDNFKIDNDSIYVISEIGTNHGGDLGKCKQMIKASAECGVNAVKLQKRNNKTLYTEELYNSPYENENSFGKTYGLHREALEFNLEQYLELKAYANSLGLTFFATAFDFESVDFLEKVGVPCYKIASGDLLNTPLQRYIASMGKPIFLSTGGGTYDDVKRAYDAIIGINQDLCIMQCTASYPAQPEDIHLGVIPEYIKRYPKAIIGLSDHYIGKLMSPVAYALGARVFEKHFTLHRWDKGTDHKFSLEPADMKKLVRDLFNVRTAMKEGKYVLDSELKPLYKMGKKLVTSRNITVGEILTTSDIKIVSPNDGIPPYQLDKILNHKVNLNIEPDETIRWEYIE